MLLLNSQYLLDLITLKLGSTTGLSIEEGLTFFIVNNYFLLSKKNILEILFNPLAYEVAGNEINIKDARNNVETYLLIRLNMSIVLVNYILNTIYLRILY